MANCEFCGEWTRPGKTERGESCGAQECERYMIEQEQAERDERHAAIDRENEW